MYHDYDSQTLRHKIILTGWWHADKINHSYRHLSFPSFVLYKVLFEGVCESYYLLIWVFGYCLEKE